MAPQNCRIEQGLAFILQKNWSKFLLSLLEIFSSQSIPLCNKPNIFQCVLTYPYTDRKIKFKNKIYFLSKIDFKCFENLELDQIVYSENHHLVTVLATLQSETSISYNWLWRFLWKQELRTQPTVRDRSK